MDEPRRLEHMFDSRVRERTLSRVELPRFCETRNDERSAPMDDQQVIGRINEIAHEEHQLWEKEGRGEITEAERERLQELGVTLDQCWDLLHQRRARRSAGLNPDDASVRDPRTVEGYTG
jgi:Protein of unknown function (DUF2630)